ncbi:MAG: O-methyltransferase [Bacteroidota bacterium]|nr:O-methyltransferase [Bacteroidota bacterium]
MSESLYNYIVDRYASKDKLLEELIKETERLEIPLIQISYDQGKFLYLLCKMINAKHALEIGTLTGFSGVHIARGLKDDGKLTTVELEQKHGDIAKKYFEKAGLKDKTEVVISPALDQMKKFVSEKKMFDFIFIDADKTGYPDYFEEAVKLSHSGTVIALDNMLKGGRVIEVAGDDKDLKAVQMTNDIISKDNRVEALLVTIGDGLSLALVK